MTETQSKARRRSPRDVQAHIRRRTLPDGARIAELLLPGGQIVTVDEVDRERVTALGVSPVWRLNGNGRGLIYVRAHAPKSLGVGNIVQVARVILGPPRGCVVKYLDGNRLNLRRSNLSIAKTTRTTAKARERFFGEAADITKVA